MSEAKFELFEGKRFMLYLEQENLCFALYETSYSYGDCCKKNDCVTIQNPFKCGSDGYYDYDDCGDDCQSFKGCRMSFTDLVKDYLNSKNKPFISDCVIPNKTCYDEWQVKQYCAEYNCCTVNDWNDIVGANCNGLRLT